MVTANGGLFTIFCITLQMDIASFLSLNRWNIEKLDILTTVAIAVLDNTLRLHVLVPDQDRLHSSCWFCLTQCCYWWRQPWSTKSWICPCPNLVCPCRVNLASAAYSPVDICLVVVCGNYWSTWSDKILLGLVVFVTASSSLILTGAFVDEGCLVVICSQCMGLPKVLPGHMVAPSCATVRSLNGTLNNLN